MIYILFLQLIERFSGRLPGYIGQGNDKCSFSHVDDVVEGHIAAMNKGRLGERYLLTGENASFNHAFDIAAILTETKKSWFNIPIWAIEVYGWASVIFSRMTGKLPLISPPVCPTIPNSVHLVMFPVSYMLIHNDMSSYHFSKSLHITLRGRIVGILPLSPPAGIA